MELRVRDIMTEPPVAMSMLATLEDAARRMRDDNIGDVVVLDDRDELCGILTDRDIVVRAVAAGRRPAEVRIGEVCSRELTTIDADATTKDAARLMRAKALRRLPVLDHGRAAGVVSLGDLAIEREPSSALADISTAPANS